jgi:GT2 family glycosyltransferase
VAAKEYHFSIITPTYNRPDRLARYLDSLTKLDYPRERFEVVLVDDGSDVPIEPLADSFRDRLNIVFRNCNHGGAAMARHVGAESASGTNLAFTDDDCTPDPAWLIHLERALASTPNCGAGGRTANALQENNFSIASQALISYLYENLNADERGATFFAANNVAFPRQRYFEVGGLDTTWPFCGEDRDLCQRWLHHGYPLVYAPDAIVRHHHDLDLRRFWKQHFNYGRGARRFRKTVAAASPEAARFQSLSFYARLPFAGFREVRGWRAFPVAALLVLSQISNAWGYFREQIRPSDKPVTWEIETAA